MSFQKIYDIITKHFANWGAEQITYRFDGYKDGVLVKSITRTAVTETALTVNADSTELIEDDTYDVTRLELLAVDGFGNRLPFADNAVKVSVEGPVSVIGPETFALVGGDRAFWVRTVGRSGKATVTVEAVDLGTYTVELNIVKK